MRKTLVLSVLFACTISGFAGNWININSTMAIPAKTRLVSSTIDRSTIQFTIGGFNLREVQTPYGNAYSIIVDNTTPILTAGAPELPKMTASLVIPDQAGMSVRVIASEYKDFPGILIAPSKGTLMRDTDPSAVPYVFGPAYTTDAFFPGILADTREPYIIRDVRGQTLIAYPFRYNPVSKILRVYHSLTVELYKSAETGINPLPQSPVVKKVYQDFQPVYSHQFLNFDAMSYVPLNEYGNLLVICHGLFMNAMQPYVDWKRSEGYQTEMVNKADIGTTAAQIKSYIANYYNTKGLTHVLLVGDSPQIPTNTGAGLGGPSDNAYGYVAGNDHYADIFIGRFSAETEAQVQTQVQRTLEYEQDPQFLSDDWYTTVIGIASDQGPGDDNEYDYEHIRNQQLLLLDYTYTLNQELFDGSQGGHDALGNPTPPMVAADVNNGASLILYTGHGSNTSWGSSGFSNSNVNQLTNVGKLPFIWSVACVNGNFTAGTCFAEAWLRASQGGQPTGAVAFLGSTINQSWNSPMEGQDEMTNILVEMNPNNIKRTFAGLSINGCMKMIDSYGSDGANMADTWTIFGDPTIMVRTAVPQPLIVSHDTLIFVGDSGLQVVCGMNGARVAATVADTILATGLVVNDTVTLTFPPLLMASDTIRLVVTAFNMLPYTKDLIVRDIPAAITAGFTAVPTRVVPGNSVAFSDTTSGSPINWHWVFPGGTPAMSNEQNPVILYDSIGIFDVKLVAGNGYSSDSVLSTGYIVVDFPAFTGNKNGSFRCTVHPNPSNGIIALDLNSVQTDLLELTVFDMVGTQVYSEKDFVLTGHAYKAIDLTFLPEGIYFLKISGKQEMTTSKLVIKR